MASTLLCTLGGQPQIITFTLDLLLQRGEPIERVMVIWLAGDARYRRAFHRLQAEFVGERYAGHAIHLLSEYPTLHGRPLARAVQGEEINAIWETFHQVLRDLKADQQHVHLSLSGGRRVMALIGFSAAMQYFGPTDRVWHLYTPPALAEQAHEGALMHAPPEAGVQLLPVPFVPLGTLFPGLRPALGLTPEQQQGLLSILPGGQDWERCVQVWEQLTPRQREVLVALVRHESRQAAADALHISLTTLDSHKQSIFAACQQAWPNAPTVNLAFLRQTFRAFIAAQVPL